MLLLEQRFNSLCRLPNVSPSLIAKFLLPDAVQSDFAELWHINYAIFKQPVRSFQFSALLRSDPLRLVSAACGNFEENKYI